MGLIQSSCYRETQISDNELMATMVAKTLSAPKIDYSLINKETFSSSKCILDIRLNDRITKDEIVILAEHFYRNEGAGCSPLYIFYFLPNDTLGKDSAWAFSHFNPLLEIKINGLEISTKEKLENAPSKNIGELIGTWIYTGVLPYRIEIIKISSNYQMTTLFSDGSGESKFLYIKYIDGEERLYENPDNFYGDYMVIRDNRFLAFYDDLGFILELPPE